MGKQETVFNITSDTLNVLKGTANVIDVLAPFIPLINDVTNLVREVVELYKKAEHNRKICGSLMGRVKMAKYAIEDIEIKRREYEESLRQKEYYMNFLKLSSVIKRIKNFIEQVSQVKGLRKFFSANSIEDQFKTLTQEFDDLMQILSFASTLKIQSLVEEDNKIIKSDLADLKDYLEKIEGGITDTNQKINEKLDVITAMHAAYQHEKLSPESVMESVKVDRGKLTDPEASEQVIKGKVQKKYFTGKIEVAVKTRSLANKLEENKINILSQVAILKKLKDCPHIIQFYGVSEDENALLMITEWAEFGTLTEYYENYGPIDWPRRIEIATDIVRGLTFLHEVSILHHDIRSKNILINRYHAAKIANFTLSRNYTDITSAMAPTLETVRYLAPEKLSDHRKNPYTTKCEIFSFGILLWEIAEEQIPYNEKTDIVEIRETVLNSKSLPFSLNVPLDWQKISLEATRHDPNLRPSLTELFTGLHRLLKSHKPSASPRPEFIHHISDPSITTINLNPKLPDTDDDDDLVIDLDITELSTVLSVEDAIQEYKKKDGDKIIAFNAFQKHASFGDLYAKYWVGYYLYYNINGNPSQDKKAQMEKAAEYFKEAADKGQIPEAQLRYGHCLWAGDGVQRSIEMAIIRKSMKSTQTVGSVLIQFWVSVWVCGNTLFTLPSETGSQQIVVDTIENGEYENRFSCEGFYNVPNCNSCQRQLYTSPTIANFKTCDYDGTQIINQDFNETRLDEFCGQRCDEAIEYLQNKNCAAERKKELTPDIELGFEADEVVRNAYLALRTRKSYYFKDPNLNNVTNLVRGIVELCQTAEHNKKICRSLSERVRIAEFAVEDIRNMPREYEEDLKKNEFYRNFVELTSILEKIKNFVENLSQIKKLRKFFNAHDIGEQFTSSTLEFDGLIRVLNFATALKIQSLMEEDNKIIKSDLAHLKDYLEKIDGAYQKKNEGLSAEIIIESVKIDRQKLTDPETSEQVTREFGTLTEYYENYGPIDWLRRSQIATDIVRGFTFLQQVSILHHDIRSQNILINKYPAAKIANFGLSRNYGDATSAMGPTLETVRYLAPEKLKDHRKNLYTTKFEIFRLLWEIAEEMIPYKGKVDIVKIREELRDMTQVCDPRLQKFSRHYINFSNHTSPPRPVVIYSISDPSITTINLDPKLCDPVNDDDDDDLTIEMDLAELSAVLSVQDAIREYKKIDGNRVNAFKAFQKHASFGDLHAKYWVGYYLYYNILGNPPQEKKAQMEKAAEYFKEPADKGEIAEAQLLYAHCLWAGHGVRKNNENAIKYFELAANNNNITAMYHIGNMYYKGCGAKKDEKKGKQFLILAALQGQPKAVKLCETENIPLNENLD
ncbi:hypothetical protein G9A89_010602 [Geosiphon pyriformis]|nr:hypothetical protein G9A89_010602 [Geosiphon pyriformis]